MCNQRLKKKEEKQRRRRGRDEIEKKRKSKIEVYGILINGVTYGREMEKE